MTAWAELEARLDVAAARGRPLPFWWRDDDVGIDHPDFPRLLELAGRWSLPVALAVVPLKLARATRARIAADPMATVIQHGFCHHNHAPAGKSPIELGWRAPRRILDELGWGRRILEHAFDDRFLPVLAPPWNALDMALVEQLPPYGFVGLSTGGRRTRRALVPGLMEANVHVDPVDWSRSRHDHRVFVGETRALGRLIATLDADEPIGIMTHHRGLDEPCWRFLDRLVGLLACHPGAEVLSAARAFAGDARA